MKQVEQYLLVKMSHFKVQLSIKRKSLLPFPSETWNDVPFAVKFEKESCKRIIRTPFKCVNCAYVQLVPFQH